MNTPLQLTMGMFSAHRNQYLFSDHYLDNLLPDDPRWPAALPEAGAFLAWLQQLYTQEQKQLPQYNETQLEEHWFKPILARLGHVFEGQASVPGLNTGVKRPDYVFFPDDAARQAAAGAQGTEEYTADALAVGEVKRWDVPLGKKQKGGGASFEAQNPSWQIDHYLRPAGLEWGILSNGRLWRLVHKDTSQRLSIYYEVDLVDLLRRGDAEAMRYFALFFQQAAFRPDAQGRVFLPDALAASMAYAVALEEDLETNVYQALERLMQGFLDQPANGLGAGDLRHIYENSLYLLYRLLFILYGESRGLLPMDRDSYRRNYSLDLIKREIAELRTPPAPMTTIYWGRLRQLFQIINGDNVALNRHLGVPRYNGRLFDPEQHLFLEQHAVGDRALVEAIDLLSRRTTAAGREFVDYRTLGVRHLGSIYEGLLEYQPRYASEAMVAVRDGKSERWVAEADLERPLGSQKTPRVVDRRDAGQIYLETDRGERKATGSYYTPQYIVEYIVDNTLGPMVEEASERANQRRSEKANGQAFVDTVLNLKVLDPAMGSGHFLVEATEYLALALATDPYVEIKETVEEDLTYWKRRVVERCIYGVDKNPLAVELAKLSLWLATVAADKPLSFLDHHLQCGDSLIGARVADLGWAPPVMLNKRAQKQLEQQKAGQINMFEYLLSQRLPVVMGRILEITEVESDSYETVRAKEAADQAVQRLKAPFRAVADLWISAYFGYEFAPGDYDEALGLIGRPDELLTLSAVRVAGEMGDERRFFHWELAFPEVFYDQNGQPLRDGAGFDAVVGNPPYSSKQSIETKRLMPLFRLISYRCDPFALFVEQGLCMARKTGYLGLIIPATWTANTYYEDLRRELFQTHSLKSVVLFDGLVFEDANVDTSIIIACREGVAERQFMMAISKTQDMEHMAKASKTYEVVELSDRFDIPPTVSRKWDELMVKLYVASIKLSETTSHISLGLRVASINEFTSSEQSLRFPDPLFLGDNIERYEPLSVEVFFDSATAPIVGGTKNPEVYRAHPKILMQSIRNLSLERRLVPTLDEEGYHFGGNVVGIILSNAEISTSYVLALLASTLLNEFFAHRFVTISMTSTFLSEIPIRRIEFTTPADEREQQVKEAQIKAEKSVDALAASGAVGSSSPLDKAMLLNAASPVLGFVRGWLAAEPEQSDVVHDLLAHLAERMIEMHKQKQSRVEAFWLDLEGVTDAEAFETLRHKGKWERTLWRKSEACRPFVDEESRSTRHLDESLAWNEEAFKVFVKALVGKVQGLSDLVGVYRAHSPAYGELVARIEATDWLIDQIVYKLYGLTEEEIQIVEGAAR